MMAVRIPLLIALITLTSCDYVHDKAREGKELASSEARELKDKAKTKIGEQVDDAFATCDPYMADTHRNRRRFREYFDTLDVPDARDIYCYTDFMGIDYTVMFSFTCDTTSLGRIVRSKGLAQGPDEYDKPGLRSSWDFPWWKEEELDRTEPFHRGKDQEDRIYLWYDPVLRRLTYQQFSL